MIQGSNPSNGIATTPNINILLTNCEYAKTTIDNVVTNIKYNDNFGPSSINITQSFVLFKKECPILNYKISKVLNSLNMEVDFSKMV